jgi:hypothetical protein
MAVVAVVVVVVVVVVEGGRVDKGQRDKGRGPERVWAAGVHHLLLPAIKAQMTGRQKPVWEAFFAARMACPSATQSPRRNPSPTLLFAARRCAATATAALLLGRVLTAEC